MGMTAQKLIHCLTVRTFKREAHAQRVEGQSRISNRFRRHNPDLTCLFINPSTFQRCVNERLRTDVPNPKASPSSSSSLKPLQAVPLFPPSNLLAPISLPDHHGLSATPSPADSISPSLLLERKNPRKGKAHSSASTPPLTSSSWKACL